MSSRVHDSEALPDKQALATVLQYLKKQNLKATEETLLKEIGFAENSGSQISASSHQPRISDTEPAKYEAAYASQLQPHHHPSTPSFPTSTKTLQSALEPVTFDPSEPATFDPEDDEDEGHSTDRDMDEDDELMIVERHQRQHLQSESSTPVDTEYQSPSSWPGTCTSSKLAQHPKISSPSAFFSAFKPSFVPMTAFDKTHVRVENNRPLWFTSTPQQQQSVTSTVASTNPTIISPTHLSMNTMIAGTSPSTTTAKIPIGAPFMYQLAATSQGFSICHQPVFAAPILTVLPTTGLVRPSTGSSGGGSPQQIHPLQTLGMSILGQQTSKIVSSPPPRRSSVDVKAATTTTPIRTPSLSSPIRFKTIADSATGQTLTSPMIEHLSVSSTGGRASPPKTLASIPPSELTQQHLELKAFAEEFKTKRIQLGYTQGSVGQSLADKGFSNFAQSTISRFEQMQLSATNAAAIKQVLEKWLQEAECPSSADSTSSSIPPMMAGRKRKKRAVFTSQTRTTLEEFFKQTPRPNRQIIEAISQQLDLLPEEVRVWFCNKRQKEKQSEGVPIISSSYSFDKDTCLSTSSSGANSPSSLYESSTGKYHRTPSPKTSFTIEELSKSSTASNTTLSSINFTSSPGLFPMLISSNTPTMTHILGSPPIAQTKA